MPFIAVYYHIFGKDYFLPSNRKPSGRGPLCMAGMLTRQCDACDCHKASNFNFSYSRSLSCSYNEGFITDSK